MHGDEFIETPVLSNFTPVSEDEMKKIIGKSNSKCCILDPIPTSLLKKCLDVLLPTICAIVNISLTTSHVPDAFKEAVVTPLIKKPSAEKENMKNYRPVSNLPYISKLLEKVVMQRVNDHLDANNLREPLQSAYCSKHSTETALVRVFSDILCTINEQKCVLLVLLDLSAAFDTINHKVLLTRLEKLFGVTGEALEWLKSYFQNRRQRVVLGTHSSVPLPLLTGVPQGSVVGPGTFPAYTKPLGKLVRSHDVDLHLYADDTQLYVGCHIPDVDATKEKLETCIADVRTWMAANMLKLNDGKTEYMVIASKNMIKQIPESVKSICIGNDNIPVTSSARNIGVMMDPTLSMELQINSICRSCYQSIRDISRIRQYLSVESTKQLITAYVTSKLDFNNALLYKVNKKYLKKLQRIQNICARIVMKIRSFVETEDIRRELHWLPIEYRIEFKLNLITFKCLQNSAPIYLQDLLQVEEHVRTTRSEGTNKLVEKLIKSKSGDRAFKNAAPKLWNNLPVNVRTANTLNKFKQLLKTHLFRRAFNIKE